jgi:hypothetical protein
MRKTLTGLALSALLVGVVAAPVRAEGLEERAFAAFAQANGFSVYDGMPGFVLTADYIDHGGPASGATFESQGQQRSYASFPYIGYQADYPGFWAAVAPAIGINDAPSAPPYPFKAAASNPNTPSQIVGDDNGPFVLKASATGNDVHGDARMGAPGQTSPFTSRAKADVVRSGAKVTASAVSLAQGIAVGPLTVQSVSSKSVTTFTQGEAAPVTTTDLSLQGGSVGSTTFNFGGGGLQVAQNGVPVPASQGLTQLNKSLEPSGFAVHFADGQKVDGGGVAAAFEIINVRQFPGAGEHTFRIRFGGATSAVQLGAQSSSFTATPVAAIRPLVGATGSTDSGAAGVVAGVFLITGLLSAGGLVTWAAARRRARWMS